MVEYFKMQELPSKDFFRCVRQNATISTDSCASMWRQTNNEGDERHSRCLNCPTGAIHAGETAASFSPFKGSMTCARCHRPSSRLIRGHVCVSCYNRERELLIGKNAKGTAPVYLRPLHRRCIRYMAGSKLVTLTLDHSAATDELIVAALRDNKHEVKFAFKGITPNFGQRQLW